MAPVVYQVGLRRLCMEPTTRLVAVKPERREPIVSLPQSIADVLGKHVTLTLECIDRLYLNVYQPKLQLERHVYRFLRDRRGPGAVSARYFQAMTARFVKDIEAFAAAYQVPLFTFERKARKEELAAQHRAHFSAPEGVLFIGKAQEKVATFRTEERRRRDNGSTYPWLVKTSA
jgi:hypothetical protein